MWGAPTFGDVGLFCGMLAATVSTTVESIGDYYSTAAASGAPMPPKHAINRGIAMEGVESIICALFGSGHGTTSYSETIGFIVVTGVG